MLTVTRSLAATAVVATAAALAACGSSNNSGGSASSSGGSGKTYVALTSADFPPMSFRDSSNSSKVVGFEVDMLKTVMGKLGWNYKLETGDFNGLIPAVQSGRADFVVSDVYDTAERRKVVDFIDYLRNSFAVMTSGSNAPNVHSYMDICGKSLGVLTGSAPELETAKAASKKCTDAGKPAITIRSYPAVAQELPQLSNGHLFALLEEWSSLAYIQKKSGGKYKVVFPDTTTATNVGMVVKKNSPIKAKLTRALNQYIQSPQYKADARKWGIQPRSLLSSTSS